MKGSLSNMEKSIRQWIEDYKNKNYDSISSLGWYDWWSKENVLMEKTEEIFKIISDINNDCILNNYYLSLKECDFNYGNYYSIRFFTINEISLCKEFLFTIGEEPRTGHRYYFAFVDSNKNIYADTVDELLSIINNLSK